MDIHVFKEERCLEYCVQLVEGLKREGCRKDDFNPYDGVGAAAGDMVKKLPVIDGKSAALYIRLLVQDQWFAFGLDARKPADHSRMVFEFMERCHPKLCGVDIAGSADYGEFYRRPMSALFLERVFVSEGVRHKYSEHFLGLGASDFQALLSRTSRDHCVKLFDRLNTDIFDKPLLLEEDDWHFHAFCFDRALMDLRGYALSSYMLRFAEWWKPSVDKEGRSEGEPDFAMFSRARLEGKFACAAAFVDRFYVLPLEERCRHVHRILLRDPVYQESVDLHEALHLEYRTMADAVARGVVQPVVSLEAH